MPNEALRKFAEELKDARESQDITLQQIANRTKIDLKFLQAIEECKFDVLPELYMRAFIKEYAQSVELDPDETITKFDSCLHGKPEEKHTPETKSESTEKNVVFESTAEDKKEAKPVEDSQTANKINQNVILLGIASVVIIVLVYFLFIDNSSKEIISQNSYSDTVTENMPAFELDSVKTPAEERVMQDDSLHLSINTSDRVWLKVVTDKNTKFEGMVNAGSSLLYKASGEFRVVVGNAAFVKMSMDGKPINDIGNPGEVRNITISPDTVIAYTLLIPSKNENKPQQKN